MLLGRPDGHELHHGKKGLLGMVRGGRPMPYHGDHGDTVVTSTSWSKADWFSMVSRQLKCDFIYYLRLLSGKLSNV